MEKEENVSLKPPKTAAKPDSAESQGYSHAVRQDETEKGKDANGEGENSPEPTVVRRRICEERARNY